MVFGPNPEFRYYGANRAQRCDSLLVAVESRVYGLQTKPIWRRRSNVVQTAVQYSFLPMRFGEATRDPFASFSIKTLR